MREIVDRKRVCCNCGRNKRKLVDGATHCYCTLDGHRIGYCECFEHWCNHWCKDRSFETKPKKVQR